MGPKIVALFMCLAVAHCMVRREVSVSTPAPLISLKNIQEHATAFHNTFTEQLRSLANVTAGSHFEKVLKNGSETVVKQLTVLSNNLREVLTDANGKVRDVIQTSYSNLENVVQQLRTQHQDMPKHTEKLYDSLQAAVKSAFVETQKITKEIASNVEETNKKLTPKIKAAYEDFVKHTQEVQKKITEAASGNKA